MRPRSRVLGAFAVLALAVGVLAASSSGARGPEAVSGADGLITPAWMPLGLSKQPVTLVVQLAGDPVAVQEDNAGRKLSKAEKDSIKKQLKAKQDDLRGSIERLGGTVLAEYQAAYNGVKVRIARDKAEQLGSLAGVSAVHPLQLMKPDNVRGVPLIGTPAVWDGLSGLHGEGVKIAVIDTGIDYTHANFGGPGTVAAFAAADAADTLPANPALFGPLAPRVKGGIDLVGDDYDADPSSPTYQPVPHPDPNPLDCNGHGSHVAGTAAGSGVTAGGATYTGPYNAATISGNSWTIGPGVAPKADIYAIRVFGCEGSTDVTVDAIEWAVDNGMDVINMSLGSPFGSKDDPAAEAATNAARAGVVVVASAGNSGPNQYITGSPASADGAISVAANDPIASSPGATLALSTGQTITVLNANGASFGDGTIYPVAVLRNSYPGGSISLGCTNADYLAYETANGAGSLSGKLVVTVRGTCSRVARAIFAEQHGAAAAAMINTSTAYPPFEGPITGSDETGPFTVTIPFFGVRGLAATAGSDGNKLVAADTGSATATNAALANTNFTGFADFSSGGPRTGDGGLKPDLTAPGVSITSTLSGSGNGPLTISGTSMASPHVAGVAALTRQAHPAWKVEDIKAAIVNTGLPSGVLGYRTSRGGTGLAQPAKSTATQVVARGSGGKFAVAVNYGFEELKSDFSETRTIKLRNNGSSPATFNVAQALPSGSPHTVGFGASSVTVPAHGDAEVTVTLNVPVAGAGASNGPGLSFREVAGLVELTPATASDNAGVTLRVPYYLVPRALSDVATKIGKLKGVNPSTTATVTNAHGAIGGDADFYAWGLEDGKDKGKVSNDVRAIGAQSFPWDATRQLLVFAVNTHDRWSNPSTNEFDIYVDVDNDGVDDYVVVGVDQGAVQTGSFNGRLGSFVFSTRSGGASIGFLAQAPTDSSTALLPLLSSQLCRSGEPCLSGANPRITYHAVSYDLQNGGVDVVDGSAKFNVWSSAISQGGFQTVAPGGSASEPIAVNSAEWALTPAKGLMVVSLDNRSGAGEAQLIKVKVK
ncbi:Subtilase [Gaiella occulta]|uniref:Subtilase n=1 Tax=Gaiella occulta TaxID=1002870 RepID=A0A7M2YTR5_9ACTN|nr:S8 family serine peptidase [Gaiella occulta]RDI73476.1 Subtilase [Gaiella occulta]